MDGRINRAAAAWRVRDGLVAYDAALGAMQDRAAAIRAGTAARRCGCWSIRRSTPPAPARSRATCQPAGFPTFAAGRGGQWTYHGPGQRTAYVMLDLTRPHGRSPRGTCAPMSGGWRSG